MEPTHGGNKSLVVATALFCAALLFGIWTWGQKQSVEQKVKATTECAEAASSAQEGGGFNGEVYKVCVEDSGYLTRIK